MQTLRIITVVGARPQFIKAAAVTRAIAAHNAGGPAVRIDEKIVHTGQHYDSNMSQVFFDELHIPAPAHHLGIGGGKHGEQTGAMLAKIEEVLLNEKPDRMLIYGDTNSTLAGALAAVKLHIPVAHVEAGLRSFNRRMPEEINRVVADCVSDLLFCPTMVAVKNLANEGVTRGVHQVGDVMYDSVLFHAAQAEKTSRILQTLRLEPRGYCLATVHRAENTDDPARLTAIFDAFSRLDSPVVVPLHPRTRKVLAGMGGKWAALAATHDGPVRIVEPLGYADILTLEKNARVILTDSGGMQKEAYFFDVPCVTMRDETEWVELVEVGANQIVGADASRIIAAVRRAEASKIDSRASGLYGDGHSAEKTVRILATWVAASPTGALRL